MKYKQEKSYGCGLFAVANTLPINNFVTEERLEESKKGNNTGQLSKWLQEDGHNLYIDCLHFNFFGGKLPEEHFNWYPEPKGENKGEELILPILINVTYSEKSKTHLIGGHIYKDKTIKIFDSLIGEKTLQSLSELNDLYHEVYGLHLFMKCECGGDYIFLTPEDN